MTFNKRNACSLNIPNVRKKETLRQKGKNQLHLSKGYFKKSIAYVLLAVVI